MALSILRIARWLAWQLGEHEQAEPPRPASIVVLSSRPLSADLADA